MLLDSEVAARQPLLAVPTTTISITASIPASVPLPDMYRLATPVLASQVSIDQKWKTLRPKVLKEQAFYMPRERRNLSGAIIADKAKWTDEEIMV
jgi:hypothetical protein